LSTEATQANSGAQKWRCAQCHEELILRRIMLEYMGHTIQHEVPVCPKCGKVYISKELAEGRMHEVEENLEDK